MFIAPILKRSLMASCIRILSVNRHEGKMFCFGSLENGILIPLIHDKTTLLELILFQLEIKSFNLPANLHLLTIISWGLGVASCCIVVGVEALEDDTGTLLLVSSPSIDEKGAVGFPNVNLSLLLFFLLSGVNYLIY